MTDNEKSNEVIRVVAEQEKLVWQVPEVIVISVSDTKSGTTSAAPMEGTFYSPSGGGGAP